jgi:hypothetical protein
MLELATIIAAGAIAATFFSDILSRLVQAWRACAVLAKRAHSPRTDHLPARQ